MRIFISAGEPSGDHHGAALIHSLRKRHPDVEFVGFGGPHMEEAGCTLVYPLCQLAVMWFTRVLANVTTFLSLLSRADRYFRHQRPDAVILIDYPGFHWWLARRAHFHGIPVYYFVPPQLWAWAGWRVKKMRRYVDHVLCSLPFEEEWYRQRGVAAHYVGHPFFDELPCQTLNAEFIDEQRRKQGTIIGLLPGSRTQEVTGNLPSLLTAARLVHERHPDTRFLVACYREAHRALVNDAFRDAKLPVEVHVGRTPEIMHLAHSCASVSGSVTLELLHHGTPTVIVYRPSRFVYHVGKRVIQCPYISLVNLLADQLLFPEFVSVHPRGEELGKSLLHWLDDPAAHQQVRSELATLRQSVAKPGACDRAAQFVLNSLHSPSAEPRLPLRIPA
ncbi:MAG: lipid-A-disaccharide synthase [Gemmataceae bacterium]|nr:lipid-A-disaccharide synthase [Gemmataceae bacterium]